LFRFSFYEPNQCLGSERERERERERDVNRLFNSSMKLVSELVIVFLVMRVQELRSSSGEVRKL
jgi:hypothetical protein